MIALDASVLIAHLDDRDAHHLDAERVLEAVSDAPLAASPLTLADVAVGATRAGTLELAMAALTQLGIEAIAMASDAPVRLAGRRAATGLKMPDCAVLLATEQGNAAVATVDASLAAAARALGLGVIAP